MKTLEILHYCPAAVATGGTESIHKLVSELNKIEGVHARIVYRGDRTKSPQPEEYKSYGCEYLFEGFDERPTLPEGFRGVVIFPEIWGNAVTDPLYKDCITAINWAGVDVYDWNVPERDRGKFLENKSTVHLCQLDYAVDHLKSLGVTNICRISDVLNDEFFAPLEISKRDDVFMYNSQRDDVILYNPCRAKMTRFQHTVIQRSIIELGLKFRALSGFTRGELIYLMRHSKLYIDFGVFSGRERLPREAAMCGCCVITSNSGAAGYYSDVAIPDKYKFPTESLDAADKAIEMIKYTLENYNRLIGDFQPYRESIIQDRKNLPLQCEDACRRFKELCQDLV